MIEGYNDNKYRINEDSFEKVIKSIIKYGSNFFDNPERYLREAGLPKRDLEKVLELIEKLSNKDLNKVDTSFNEKLVLCSSSGY